MLGGDEPPQRQKRQFVYKETKVQVDFVNWLRARPDWMVLRVENEQKRTPAQAARADAMGMCKGAPDLLVLYKRTLYFWELKADGKDLSPKQVDIHHQLNLRGQNVIVTRGIQETITRAESIEREHSRRTDTDEECGRCGLPGRCPGPESCGNA